MAWLLGFVLVFGCSEAWFSPAFGVVCVGWLVAAAASFRCHFLVGLLRIRRLSSLLACVFLASLLLFRLADGPLLEVLLDFGMCCAG
jgi:hypothetical protein